MSDDSDQPMNKMSYPKDKILAIVRKNRAIHEKEYNEAMAGYRKEVMDTLRKRLADAQKGLDVDHDLHLARPTGHLDEYDRAIRMFELTVAKKIVMDQQLFAQLVLDEWHWKLQFASTNSTYINRR